MAIATLASISPLRAYVSSGGPADVLAYWDGSEWVPQYAMKDLKVYPLPACFALNADAITALNSLKD